MADPNPQFEQQVQDLHEDVLRRKERYEGSNVERETSPERRALHEAIGERLDKSQGQNLDSRDSGSHPTKGKEPSYQSPELRDKVQELVNMAFEKDINSAIDRAKKEDNPALLDAFHDALVDYLYDHLVERGKLEQL
ncbi:MAG: hypothetical protein R3346_02380 [Candidatus Spechtbacterales bacterium]|nr:hypothetical protein [Candidatus Spechtbacterales bacterium]